jgi:hypothetical protein
MARDLAPHRELGMGWTPRPWSPRTHLATRRRPSRVNHERRAHRRPWRRAGLRRKPRLDARRGQPLHQPVPTLHARCLAHSVIRTSARSRTGVGSRRHRRVAVAAPAPAPDAPRRPPAIDLAPSETNNPRESKQSPRAGQTPRRCGTRRRRGLSAPPLSL